VPPEPHIDGIPTGLNGLTGDKICNFTALVGVFLTTTPSTFAGNFTVWPGSHLVYEKYFRERGPGSMREGMPTAEPGQPVQLICNAGDAVFCHYQLGHTAVVNTSDVDRVAIYFRIWLRNIGDIEERRWQLLTDIWQGWRL
jgi:ectoine hydroxylase-related dioxygenase (phytanoyl-CoA dioxygenase family)